MAQFGPTLTDTALLRLLEVSGKLAGPCELTELLQQIIDAGREVLHAERGTVFLYDPPQRELYLKVAHGVSELRFSIDKGIAGECARTRQIVNVPDCYADPRFNREVDRRLGYRTHCLIAIPLIGLEDELVGVLQLLNAAKGHFDVADEPIAQVLANQAAVAIQRARLLDERLVKLKLERDLDLARQIQLGVLPKKLPVCPGYELAVFSRPAEQTGGDIYDLVRPAPTRGQSPEAAPLMLLLADATGHGVGPALSVTQARAMFRVGLRFAPSLEELVLFINHQLSQDLASSRFITAFFGRLDPLAHQVDYIAAGQGPLLHYRASDGACTFHNASTLPLGVIDDLPMEPTPPMTMGAADMLVLLTDGFYEATAPDGQMLGKTRVAEVVAANREGSAQQVMDAIVEELMRFTGGRAQADDLTAIVLKRRQAPADPSAVHRSADLSLLSRRPGG